MSAHQPSFATWTACTSSALPRPSSSAPAPHPRPLRVAIAGAGIAGLSTALTLSRRLPHARVTLLDPRPRLDEGLGGAINLNGGAAVLAKCYGLEAELWDVAAPMRRVVGRAADGAGWWGGELFEVDVGEVVRGGGEERLVHNGRVQVVTVMRSELQRVLAEALPETVEIRRGVKVVGVDVGSGHGAHRYALDDGTRTGDFDLLVGADGLRSAVRKHVAPAAPGPVYSGIRIQFAISPPNPQDVHWPPVGTVEQWFGDGAYALVYGAGPAGPTRHSSLVLSFQSPTPRDENEAYRSSDAVRADLLSRLHSARMPPHLLHLVSHCARFIEVGVYYHTPLHSWTTAADGGPAVVLVGDACHAMPPFLGQGANQAIQDAHALACEMERACGEGAAGKGGGHEALREALREYERRRRGPTAAVMRASRAVGFVETQAGMGGAVRNVLLGVGGVTGLVGKAFVRAATPTVL